MRKPDSQVAYNLQLSLGWLPCNVHEDRSGLSLLWLTRCVGSQPTILSIRLLVSIPAVPIFPIFFIRLFFFSPFYFSYLFFVLRDLRVFFLLADFLPPSITNPRGFSRKRLAKEESCSTWKYNPVANFVAAIQHFFLDKVGNVCTLRSLIYHQVHSFVSSPSFFLCVCVFNFKFRDETNAIFNQTNLEGYTLYTYPVNGEEVPSISRPVYPICLI